jgi:hypothetical protein
MRNGSIQVSDGWDRLSTLRDGGTHVTYLTDDLLAYEGEDARRDFLSENKDKVPYYSTAALHLVASKLSGHRDSALTNLCGP